MPSRSSFTTSIIGLISLACHKECIASQHEPIDIQLQVLLPISLSELILTSQNNRNLNA